MYILASRRVVLKDAKGMPGGATFATLDAQRKGKKGLKSSPDDDKEKADAMYLAKLAKMRCYNCGEKGHISKNCPNAKSDEEDEPEEDEPPLAGLTLACCATVSKEPETRLFE